jgi:hypothetical protein
VTSWCKVQWMSSTKSPAVPENSSKAIVFSTQPTMRWSVLDGCSSRQHTIKNHFFESFGRPCILISKNLLARIYHLRLSRNNLA